MTEEKKDAVDQDATEDMKTAGVQAPPANQEQTETTESDTDIVRLSQALDATEIELKETKDRLLRQVAELENYKKRVSREKEETLRFANETMVKDLLPVVDNLERALSHANEQESPNGKALIEGVEMVLKGLLDTLGKHGVVPIVAVGQPFDPSLHEAVAQVESESVAANAVVDEYSKGYLLRDRLVRPAMVSVSKGLISQEKKNADGEVENHPSDD